MCSGPTWKREVVPDHKFDFVDTRDFTDNGFLMRAKYLWLYLIVLKSFLVYVSDIFTAITMISTKSWSNQIFSNCDGIAGCVVIDFNITKWLFVGCILFSFLLLAYESRKAKKIVASRDISYAFTNVMASSYYSLRSYDHFCFFDHISNSTKKKDDIVFFIFFTFKSWKRLLLADGPRQCINGLTLWSIFLSRTKDLSTNWYDFRRYFPEKQPLSVSALTVTTFFTFLVFAGSLLLLIAAAVMYIPALCYIQGNLKEYVCHKVDKRISQIIKRKNKERLNKAAELAKKEAKGDFTHLKNKKGEMLAQPLPQPTLPNLSVDDDFDDSSTVNTRVQPGGYSDYKGDGDYPPMPGYQQGYGYYGNPSQGTFVDPQGGYDDDQVGLAGAAAPFAYNQGYIDRPGSAQPSPGGGMPNPHGYFDPHDVYQGRAGTPLARTGTPQGRASPAPPQHQQYRTPSSLSSGHGLAYEEDYSSAYGVGQAPHQGYIEPGQQQPRQGYNGYV